MELWDTFLLLYVNLDLSCDMHVTYLVLASEYFDYSVQVSFCNCIYNLIAKRNCELSNIWALAKIGNTYMVLRAG